MVDGWLLPAATALAGALVWTARLRPFAAARRAPLPAAPPVWPRISIIVPARNEARALPALLASLARLRPAPAEVIVVDDHSTDGTAMVARRAGARVVTPPPLPAGWLGKPWACAAGAAVARGQWLLFTDADTVHAPASLGLAAGALHAARAGLVSASAEHLAISWWERLQGVFQLLLVVATGAAAAPAIAAGGERRFCVGQYLLFRRSIYQAIGGHAAVRDRVAEDLAFARLVVQAGARYQLLAVPGMVRVRMYGDGLRAFVAGWRRNFREGLRAAGARGVLEVTAVMAWLLGPPLWGVAAALAGDGPRLAVAAIAYLATSAEVARRQRLVMAPPVGGWTALPYPAFAALFVVASALALLDRARGMPVSWKGRALAVHS